MSIWAIAQIQMLVQQLLEIGRLVIERGITIKNYTARDEIDH